MNIHGYKKKIQDIKRELRKGKKELGSHKYNQLQKRKENYQRQIRRLRKEREVTKKKR